MHLQLLQETEASPLTFENFPQARGLAWMPDGEDIYVISAEGGVPRQLTKHPAEDVVPNWSRDGDWIYFASNRSGEYQVWKVPASGGEPTLVTRCFTSVQMGQMETIPLT